MSIDLQANPGKDKYIMSFKVGKAQAQSKKVVEAKDIAPKQLRWDEVIYINLESLEETKLMVEVKKVVDETVACLYTVDLNSEFANPGSLVKSMTAHNIQMLGQPAVFKFKVKFVKAEVE